MKSEGKLLVFKSGPEGEEKWWENVWFQHASKNDGAPWQNGWFQKLMDSPGKMDGVKKPMKTVMKIDGFKGGPQTKEN